MICHLLSELVLFSSKLSHTKVPNINSMRQSHAFLPAIVRSQKSPRYRVPSPRSCHLLLMTGGPTNSLCLDVTGFAEAPNRKTAWFTGSGGCETWWEIFFYFLIHIWYCFISLFFSYPLTDLLELVLPIDKVVNMY